MLDNKKQEDKMIEIVNSPEAKEVFENGLKVLDPKALTENGEQPNQMLRILVHIYLMGSA